MYCAHPVKTAVPFPAVYPDGRLARWARLGLPRPMIPASVGSERVCAECFARREAELRRERVAMARELTLARLLPFADVLSYLQGDALDWATPTYSTREDRDREMCEDALRAIMETV